MTEPDDELRLAAFALATTALVAVLLALIFAAKYTALYTETRDACAIAAAPLDLSSWVPLCKEVSPS